MTTLNITAVPAMTLTVSDGTQSVDLTVEPAPELTLVMGAGQGPSGPQGPKGDAGELTVGATAPTATPNSVAYFNGSKALTTGSALTFDGSLLSLGQYLGANGRLNITTASSGTFQTGAYMTNAIDADFQIRFKTGITDIGTGAATPLTFSYAGTEQMRLTSTGLGIGTSSPTQKLTVSGAANFSRFGINSNPIDTVSTSQSFARFQSTGADFYIGTESSTGSAFFPSSTAYAAVLYNANATPMHFYTSGALRATLDPSGNLGLGVVPSGWSTGSGIKAVDLGAAGGINGSNGGVTVSSNTYFNGSSWIYKTTNYASYYEQNSGGAGTHAWYTAPSGTAGNAISFTQAMTLGADARLRLYGSVSDAWAGSSADGLQLSAHVGDISTITTYLDTSSIRIGSGVTQKTGILITGQTSASGSTVQFSTGGSERARIDSSGNLLVGTTSFASSNSNSVLFSAAFGAGYFQHEGSTGSGATYCQFNYAGSAIGSITQNGTTAVAYNTSSDYRLKNITGSVSNSGAYIDSLNPVEGTWKADGSTFVGLIAHEVQEVSRTPVATGVKDGEEMQAMDYSSSELIANMIAELKSLRARVAQLESN
jgi:Chaperone of endosialidase